MSGRVILHVDMDAFFAWVEIRDDPQLRGKPVLVGGIGKRGVVTAASYEARAFGCRSAQPMAVAVRLCPDAIVLPGRHSVYASVSEEVFAVFRAFTPLVEGLSIDEAFLDLGGTERLHGPPEVAAAKIQRAIREAVDLPCSVGVATCKLVAKIASALRKPEGLVVVPEGEEAAFLAPLSVRRLFGVGPKTAEILASFGITKIGDIAAMDERTLVTRLGDHGRHLQGFARGIDVRPVEPGRDAKSMGHEDTFAEDLVGSAALERSLLDQSTRVADRLVRAGLRARQVSIKIRTHDFSETFIRQTTLGEATDEARIIFERARGLLRKLPIEGKRFRLTGVSVARFVEAAEQLDLLSVTAKKRPSAQSVLSSIRDRFGVHALFPGDPSGDD